MVMEFTRGISWRDLIGSWRDLFGDENSLREKFWRKLQPIARELPFAEDLLAVYYCAFDRQTPLSVKATLVAGLAYFVMPADAIPDFIPVVGFIDDAAAIGAVMKIVSDHIKPEHRLAARVKLGSY
jgi:uncharacterized membrane protein YkvA (DUF1232 family)